MATFDSAAVNQALRGLKHGDRSCADAVFRMLWPIVSAFCRKAMGSDAQDVAQETLLKVFQQAHHFRPDGDAVAWALEIATWECRTELRRRGRKEAALAGPASPPRADDGPDAAVERQQFSAALRESINLLSEHDQALVVSLLAETFPANAAPAARKRKERALIRLRRVWRSLYGTE